MGDQEAVVLLVDLDDRPDCVAFKKQLTSVLQSCKKPPKCLIRIAIEELEAWYLGDEEAIKDACGPCNEKAFKKYSQDSQCGTWEILAEAIHPGGVKELFKHGKRSVRILKEKRKWATMIPPKMNIEKNKSPSFCRFRDGLRRWAEIGRA